MSELILMHTSAMCGISISQSYILFVPRLADIMSACNISDDIDYFGVKPGHVDVTRIVGASASWSVSTSKLVDL